LREAFIEGVQSLDTKSGELYNERMKRLMMIFIILIFSACSELPPAHHAHLDALYYDYDNDGIRDDYHF